MFSTLVLMAFLPIYKCHFCHYNMTIQMQRVDARNDNNQALWCDAAKVALGSYHKCDLQVKLADKTGDTTDSVVLPANKDDHYGHWNLVIRFSSQWEDKPMVILEFIDQNQEGLYSDKHLCSVELRALTAINRTTTCKATGVKIQIFYASSLTSLCPTTSTEPTPATTATELNTSTSSATESIATWTVGNNVTITTSVGSGLVPSSVQSDTRFISNLTSRNDASIIRSNRTTAWLAESTRTKVATSKTLKNQNLTGKNQLVWLGVLIPAAAFLVVVIYCIIRYRANLIQPKQISLFKNLASNKPTISTTQQKSYEVPIRDLIPKVTRKTDLIPKVTRKTDLIPKVTRKTDLIPKVSTVHESNENTPNQQNSKKQYNTSVPIKNELAFRNLIETSSRLNSTGRTQSEKMVISVNELKGNVLPADGTPLTCRNINETLFVVRKQTQLEFVTASTNETHDYRIKSACKNNYHKVWQASFMLIVGCLSERNAFVSDLRSGDTVVSSIQLTEHHQFILLGTHLYIDVTVTIGLHDGTPRLKYGSIVHIENASCIVGGGFRDDDNRHVSESTKLHCYVTSGNKWFTRQPSVNVGEHASLVHRNILYVCTSRVYLCLLYNLTATPVTKTEITMPGYRMNCFQLFTMHEKVYIIGDDATRKSRWNLVLFDLATNKEVLISNKWNFVGVVEPCDGFGLVHSSGSFNSTFTSNKEGLNVSGQVQPTSKEDAKVAFIFCVWNIIMAIVCISAGITISVGVVYLCKMNHKNRRFPWSKVRRLTAKANNGLNNGSDKSVTMSLEQKPAPFPPTPNDLAGRLEG